VASGSGVLANVPILTLTTDFGLSDPYVGVMKGVVLSLCPACQIVDLTHAVRPQDVRAGAVQLRRALPYFPPGTIHVGVVDPGVGSARAALILETESGFLVGPDNGLFGLVLRQDPLVAAYEIPVPGGSSATFHGRDVFAPTAARLAAGMLPDQLGTRFELDLINLDWPAPRPNVDGMWTCEVLLTDHYGNLLTNLHRSVCSDPREVLVSDTVVPFARTYSDVPLHSLVALWGSDDYLEIGCNRGRASEVLGLRPGDAVKVQH
jgi:S-adenosylmethionine hydrolase